MATMTSKLQQEEKNHGDTKNKLANTQADYKKETINHKKTTSELATMTASNKQE